MMATRNETIDIAKAVGIILMVVGHTRCPDYLRQLIYLFHMPLFFLFSGYFFNQKYLDNKKMFIKRKLKTLYLPYVKWSLLFLLIYNFCFEINIYSEKVSYFGIVFHPYSIQDYFRHALSILFSMTEHAPLLGGFWFLHSILWGNIIFLFSLRCIKGRKLMALLFIMTCLFLHFKIIIPIVEITSLDVLAALFIAIGFYLKEIQGNLMTRLSTWKVVCCCLVLLLLAYLLPVSFQSVTAKKLIFFIFSGVAGTTVTVKFATFIQKYAILNKIMPYIGQNTLTILALHILCFRLVSYIICICTGMALWHMGEHPTIDYHSGGGIMDNILFMWSCYTIIALKVVSWIIKYYKNEVTYGKVVCM